MQCNSILFYKTWTTTIMQTNATKNHDSQIKFSILDKRTENNQFYGLTLLLVPSGVAKLSKPFIVWKKIGINFLKRGMESPPNFFCLSVTESSNKIFYENINFGLRNLRKQVRESVTCEERLAPSLHPKLVPIWLNNVLMSKIFLKKLWKYDFF